MNRKLHTRNRVPEGVDLLHLELACHIFDDDLRHLCIRGLGAGNIATVPIRGGHRQGGRVSRIVLNLNTADDARVSLRHVRFGQDVRAIAEIDGGHQSVGPRGVAAGAVGVALAVLQCKDGPGQGISAPGLLDDLHAGTGVRDGGFPYVVVAARGFALVVGGDVGIVLLCRLTRLQAAHRHGPALADGRDRTVGRHDAVGIHTHVAGQHDLTHDILLELTIRLKVVEEIADRGRAVGQLPDGTGEQRAALQVDGHIDRIMRLHEGIVRPYLLDGQAPTSLVVDLHLGVTFLLDPSVVDSARNSVARRACTGGSNRVQANVFDKRIAGRNIIGLFRHFEPCLGEQLPDLKGVSSGDIVCAAGEGRFDLRIRQLVSQLVEIAYAEGNVLSFPQRAVISFGIPHIIDAVPIGVQFLPQEYLEPELSVVILRGMGVRALQDGGAVLGVQYLLHGKDAQRIELHMVLIGHPLPLPNGGRFDLIILQRCSLGHALKDFTVGLDPVENVRIHAAFLDIILNGIVAVDEVDLRRLPGLQEENMLVCPAADCIRCFVRYRFVAALEMNVLYIPVGRIGLLCQQLEFT